MVVGQASVQDFLGFADNQAYVAGIGHRRAALEDSRLPLVEANPLILRDGLMPPRVPPRGSNVAHGSDCERATTRATARSRQRLAEYSC